MWFNLIPIWGRIKRWFLARRLLRFQNFVVVMSIVGGVPGIIAIKDYFDRKPKLKFIYSAVVTIPVGSRTSPHTMFVISGGFINLGDRSFYPMNWKMKIRLNDGTYLDLDPYELPKKMSDVTTDSTFTMDSTARDISKTDVFPPASRVNGQISFITNELPYNMIDSMRTQTILICQDINEEEYEFPKARQGGPSLLDKGDVYFPVNGIRLRPKKSKN